MEFNLTYFVVILLSFTVSIIDTINSYGGSKNAEYQYINYYLKNGGSQSSNDLCSEDTSKYKKISICLKLMETFIYHGIYTPRIEINKPAMYYLSMDCIETTLTFNHETSYNDLEIKQEMFPCYGSHKPMLIDWDEDDNLDVIYVSNGKAYNSVFVYKHEKKLNGDSYSLHSHVINFNIDALLFIPLVSELNEITEELSKSLQTIAVNEFAYSIEINYLRVFSDELITNNGPDPICDLGVLEKQVLCKTIYHQVVSKIKRLLLIPEKRFSEDLVSCQSKTVIFKSIKIEQGNEIRREVNTYQCYNISTFGSIILGKWFLSQSYRPNSVMLLKENDDKQTLRFYAIIDNIDLNTGKAFDIRNKMLRESPSRTLNKYTIQKGIEKFTAGDESTQQLMIEESDDNGGEIREVVERSRNPVVEQKIKEDEYIDVDELVQKQKPKEPSMKNCCLNLF